MCSSAVLTENTDALVELKQQGATTAAVVALVHEDSKDITQSLACIQTTEGNAASTRPSTRTLPGYAMEQIITLNSRLLDGGDFRTLVPSVLSRLISPELSEEIHCTGKGRPFVFKNSRIHGFLLGKLMLLCSY
ncbi:unnamed protein product [Calicophoron daubneyi]|uniref:Uncharacterized protein n=1 Tax=Calicophoron daubneyi TaxID=300641 RepID=A0AAV2T8J1_CALDB